MREESIKRCEICGDVSSCVYLRDWGAWVCFDCYCGKSNLKLIKPKEIS